MVFPYMDHDLAGLLENKTVRLEVPHIKQYAKQLLMGTAYLHQVSRPSRFLTFDIDPLCDRMESYIEI